MSDESQGIAFDGGLIVAAVLACGLLGSVALGYLWWGYG